MALKGFQRLEFLSDIKKIKIKSLSKLDLFFLYKSYNKFIKYLIRSLFPQNYGNCV